MDILIVLGASVGLVLVFYALAHVTDEYFIHSLEYLSGRLKLTSDMAGATLMAMGSSAPEFFTSLIALSKAVELGELGAGTIVGSAIFNILVIVGASALVTGAMVSWQPVVRDLTFYLISIGLLLWAFADGVIVISEAAIFVVFYFVYLAALPLWRKLFPYKDQAEGLDDIIEDKQKDESKGGSLFAQVWRGVTRVIDGIFRVIMPGKKNSNQVWLFVMSVVSISVLSWILVECGVILASTLGIPKAVIALIVLAVGTSVPDLLSSLFVARRGRADMAISNAVGSNIFDILVGLGVVWLFIIAVRGENIPISNESLTASTVLLLLTVVALLFSLIISRWRMGRVGGLLLLGLYGLYFVSQVLDTLGVIEINRFFS